MLKSTLGKPWQLNLSPAVINEVTILGSRCGAFTEAIDALGRKEVDVLSMISRIIPLHKVTEAFKAAESPDNIKVLLEVSKS